MNKDIVFKENDKLIKLLKENKDSIKYLRICWIDIGNKIRCKSMNVETLLKEGDSKLIYLTLSDICNLLLSFVDDIGLPLDDLKDKEFGVVYLIPDVSTFTILPYSKSHAQVIGSLYKVNNSNGNLEPWDQCTRHCLINAINKLSKDHSISLKGSFEEEFYLIKKNKMITYDNIDFDQLLNEQLDIDKNTTSSFHSLDNYGSIINELSYCLIKQGIPIEDILKESGTGQFEITIKYDNVLKACDRHIIFRQTVHSVASLNGYIATFIPKPYQNVIGSGCHAHLSLWDVNSGINITPDEKGECGLSNITRQFIAGILYHSPSLTAIFNPSLNSYERLVPSPYNGTSVSWGIDNKGAFCRVPSNPFSKGNTNFELKTIDHTSNPYLTIASIIHCGIYGIVNQCEPPPSKSILINTIKDLNIPSNLIDALNNFNSNEYLKCSLGNDISNIFYKTKQAEEKILSKLSNNDQKKLKILEIY